ncbi:MAG: hypothetical protein ACP5E3_11675 [Bacteroidales bacterium]
MYFKIKTIISGIFLLVSINSTFLSAQERITTNDKLVFHHIVVNKNGEIEPWYDENPGISYDHIIDIVWSFWDTMRTDYNGLPYYMNHSVWVRDKNDSRGIAGDQFAMALSSWQLLYQYTGNMRVSENMNFIADYYLEHSLSSPSDVWPNIPYPSATLRYSGRYDGDMILGKNFTQPDKAGSFGFELIKLYKMSNYKQRGTRYLDAAIEIANTLAKNCRKGDDKNSPLPFRVNAVTGEIGPLLAYGKNRYKDIIVTGKAGYTTNFSGTLGLFLELIKMEKGNTGLYQKAFDQIIDWMKEYPLKTNKWGPFFEDMPGWSDTQINPITFAWFMMKHPEYFHNWKSEVPKIFDWVYATLENNRWAKYGVTTVNEQTTCMEPANSHNSRQACAELLYCKLSGDSSRHNHAVRLLNWATYSVNTTGENRFNGKSVWLSDGYGDYIRHYLRAMAIDSTLSDPNENHILKSSSILTEIEYADNTHEELVIQYRSYDESGSESIRMTTKPSKVVIDNIEIPENHKSGNCWVWNHMEKGGLLVIKRSNGLLIKIFR